MQKILISMGYDINNPKGDSCRGLNIIDLIFLFFYLGLVLSSLWMDGIKDISYFATIVLSIRSFLKFWVRHKKVKRNKNEVAIVHIVSIIIFLSLFCLMALIYSFSDGQMIKNVAITVYYIVLTAFEIIEILVRCYDAEPHIYR